LTYTRNNVDTQLGPVYVSNNDNIVVFPETDFQSGDLITVEGGTTTDTFTIDA